MSVSFDQCNESLLDKSIHSFTIINKKKKIMLVYVAPGNQMCQTVT